LFYQVDRPTLLLTTQFSGPLPHNTTPLARCSIPMYATEALECADVSHCVGQKHTLHTLE